MAQYIEGLVSIKNNSATVWGFSTDFLTANNVKIGDLFKKRYENAFYTVSAVVLATQLTITPVYAGVNASAVSYVVIRDFTANLDLPEMSPGDLDFQDQYTRAVRLLDTEMFEVNVSSPNANATILATHDVVLGSGNITLALPNASNRQRVSVCIRSSGATLKVLASSPPDYIASSGATLASITRTTQFDAVTLVGDGGYYWYKV